MVVVVVILLLLLVVLLSVACEGTEKQLIGARDEFHGREVTSAETRPCFLASLLLWRWLDLLCGYVALAGRRPYW